MFVNPELYVLKESEVLGGAQRDMVMSSCCESMRQVLQGKLERLMCAEPWIWYWVAGLLTGVPKDREGLMALSLQGRNLLGSLYASSLSPSWFTNLLASDIPGSVSVSQFSSTSHSLGPCEKIREQRPCACRDCLLPGELWVMGGTFTAAESGNHMPQRTRTFPGSRQDACLVLCKCFGAKALDFTWRWGEGNLKASSLRWQQKYHPPPLLVVTLTRTSTSLPSDLQLFLGLRVAESLEANELLQPCLIKRNGSQRTTSFAEVKQRDLRGNFSLAS